MRLGARSRSEPGIRALTPHAAGDEELGGSDVFRRSRLVCCASIALIAASGCTRETTPLIDRINTYRSAPGTCAGKAVRGVGPLAPSALLSKVKLAGAETVLTDALREAGYSAARAQAIVLSGPSSAGAAMSVLTERYCDALLAPQFSEIGIARDGRTWRLVLARPLIPQDLGDWVYAGKQVLALVNAARSQPRSCGKEQYGAAPPLEWNAQLAGAAVAHSRDMAKRNYFAHRGRDGTLVADRAVRAGYDWARIGENIAAGQGSAGQAVASWLASPTHCANLMQPDYTQMGAAYVTDPASDIGIYWTQVLGKPGR